MFLRAFRLVARVLVSHDQRGRRLLEQPIITEFCPSGFTTQSLDFRPLVKGNEDSGKSSGNDIAGLNVAAPGAVKFGRRKTGHRELKAGLNLKL